MRFTLIDTILLLVSFSSLPIPLFAYFRNRKNSVNISFAIFALGGSLWAFNIAMFRMSTSISSAWFWDKAIYIVGNLPAAAFLYFSFVFPKKEKPLAWLVKIGITLPVFIFSYFILFTKGLFIKDVILTTDGNSATLGLVYLVWVAWFGLFMGLALANLLSKYRKVAGVVRTQLKFILLSLLLPITLSFPFNMILPYFGNYHLIWIGPLSLIGMIVIIFYAIARHRLMDIRFALGRGAVYVFSFLTVLAYASSMTYVSNRYLGPAAFNTTGSLILIVSIILFQPIFKFFEKVASQYFYYTLYSSQTVLTDLGEKLTHVLELDKLSTLIVETLMNTMKLDRVVVLLREPGNGDYRIQQNIGFREENGIALVKDNFLTLWLEKTRKPVVYGELSLLIQEEDKTKEKQHLETLQETMKRIEAILCLPLLFEEKIIGMIVLGNKISGDPYSEQDVDLLASLANQASIALQNAKHYSEIKTLSTTLEKKVEERTKELKDLTKKLEEANLQIQSVEKMKSDLLNMASHEFRTPAGIIKNSLWFLNKDEEKKNFSDKAQQNLERMIEASERLDYILDNVQKMLETTTGDFKLDLSPVQLEILIKEVVEGKTLGAQEKQIKLTFEEPKKLLPTINADATKLKYVFWELLTNALKYTETGGSVTISTDQKDKTVEVKVADTGCGIPKERLENIFTGFAKPDIIHTHQAGMGLGLHIVKKIVDLHDGQAQIESKESSGTTVTLTLPAV